MKKTFKLLISFCVCIYIASFGAIFAGCTQNEDPPDIVVTIFPPYDWVVNILGDNPNGYTVKYLLGTGLDLHNYSPSTKDVSAIASCKLFIYVGGESDVWAKEVLDNNPNSNRKVISLTEAAEHEHDEAEHTAFTAAEEEEEHDHSAHEDEHVWLSLVTAQGLADVIAETLGEIDTENAELYESNAHDYINEINELHGQYQTVMESVNAHDVRIAVADRNPFILMFEDYDIHDTQIASAFDGCAAEVEITFTIKADMIAFVKDNGVDVILTIEKPSDAIKNLANSVKDESGTQGQVLALHSGQNVSSAEIEAGFTYLKMVTDNLDVFTLAVAEWETAGE